MKKVITCIAALFFTYCLHAQQQPKQPENNEAKFPAASTYANTKLTYKIIDAPGLPGNKGFKTKTDAEKVAKLVVSKIKKGEMPPTVSSEELKKLNIISPTIK